MQIKILHLECDQTDPQHANVVQIVHYSISKTVGEHTANTYGTKSLGKPDNSFTDFERLTQEQVIEWCDFDVDAIEASLDTQLAQLANPRVVGMSPPWGM